MKKRLVFTCFLIFIFGLTGCLKTGKVPVSNSSAGKEKTFTVAVPKLPITLDPTTAINTYDIIVISQVSEPLIKQDSKTTEPIAGIAKSWDIKDGRIYTFHLNDNVYFSNGKLCTAYDFKYSYEKYLTPEAPASYMLEPILGSREKLSGKTTETKGIKVPDDFTLEITLDKPNLNFLSVLASPCLIVIDKDEVTRKGRSFGRDTITGVGPFVIESKKPKEIVLVRNDRYYGKKAYINKVKLVELTGEQAWEEYKKGETDFIFDIPGFKKLTEDPIYKNQIKNVPFLNTVFLSLNVNKAPLKSNLKLRQAINCAIDKEKIAKLAYGNNSTIVANVLTSPLLSGRHDDEPTFYNKEKAKALLAEAGYPGGQGLPELKLTYHDRINQKILVETIRDDLAAVNIKVKLIRVDESLAIPYIEGVTDLFRISWCPDYIDIDAYLRPVIYSQGYANLGRYKNKEVDALMDEAQLTPNFAARKELLTQAEMIALKEYPVIPLYWGQYTTITSSRVSNLQITPDGFPVLTNVFLED